MTKSSYESKACVGVKQFYYTDKTKGNFKFLFENVTFGF